MSKISTDNMLAQSPYLYLQGAGSDKTDGSAPGVHLRWTMLGSLGESHIPTGNMASNHVSNFKKSNDFVKIYRTKYDYNFPIIVDLSTTPSKIIDKNNNKAWEYAGITPIAKIPTNKATVKVRFANPIKYNVVKQTCNPQTEPLRFLKEYDELIEVEVERRMMFSAFVMMEEVDSNKPNITRIESISKDAQENELFISNRKKYNNGEAYLQKEDLGFLLQENDGYLALEEQGSGTRKIMGENIQYIRFQGSNCYPTMLWLETYDDFILGKNESQGWEEIAQLSLSDDDEEVFKRLEEADEEWPRFTAENKLKIKNYQDKWLYEGEEEGDKGIKGTVNGYLSGADAYIGSGFSFLEMLKLMSFDFHIARMLGFGYIDANIESSSDKYIYIASYNTPSGLSNATTHTYMTLPLCKTDYKTPVAPKLKPLKYGLYVNNGTDASNSLTDENGYFNFENTRVVNLEIENIDIDLPFEAFFRTDNEFSYIDYTKPVFFGIEYKKAGEAGWRNPKLSVDDEYFDHNKHPEIVPVLPSENNMVYSHFEKEAGIHAYAVYGINWFSRPSAMSNVQETDNTLFLLRNTLIPPSNFTAHLVQKEETPFLTTEAEQKRLDKLDADKTLVRLTFDWNEVHAANYWCGNQAEFFFKPEVSDVVRGVIKHVEKVSSDKFEIRTEGFVLNSLADRPKIFPYIAKGMESMYINSFFNLDEGIYMVEEIRQSNITDEGPIFIIRMVTDKTLLDAEEKDIAVDTVKTPEKGQYFAVSENITNANNWGKPLTAKVSLKKFSEHEEKMLLEGDPEEKIIKVGGIWKEATITQYEEKDDNRNYIPGSKSGLYEILFNSNPLDPHEDNRVEWYKGTVRIKTINDEMKTLEVWHIDNSGPKLKLIAYDATFDVDENYNPRIVETDEEGNKTILYTPIVTGSNIFVNFHPGYRVYLTAEDGFNESTIMPARGEGSKQTFMACRSNDTKEGFSSPLSMPTILTAIEIITPLPPEKPEGPTFATRPDFYGKATYTFDTKMNTDNGTREPYALVFFRGNDQAILDILYKPKTVAQIKSDLADLGNDLGRTSRWNELVNGEIDLDTKKFRKWNGYGFPNPDNDKYVIPRTTEHPFNASIDPGSKNIDPEDKVTYLDKIKAAINGVFFPLTEQPVLYDYVKPGYQPSNKKPVIRDTNGNLLIPNKNAEYDPAPMAVKYDGANKEKMVRFTDYTLDGASNAIFFYYAIEMNNLLATSKRSEILGPIQLVNTDAPRAPEFKKFYTQTANESTEQKDGVVFEINNYLASDGITKIQIYRSFESKDTQSIRTMKLAKTIDVNEPIVDDFSDLDYLPFGDPLYYRLVAMRTITNEFNELEDVPSMQSSLVLSGIIDTVNPAAPEIDYTAQPDSEGSLDVILKWNKSVHNGTYHLYKMTSSGNWATIDSIKSNDPAIEYPLTDALTKTDEDGNTLYHRFKLTVENSSGLFSANETILII